MPTPTTLDALSTEFIWVPVVSPTDPTGDPVSLAFVSSGKPGSGDWKNADWDDRAARILLGPGAVALTPGTYSVWIRITDDPAVPVINAGQLVIT